MKMITLINLELASIINIYFKTKTIDIKTYKLINTLTDYYLLFLTMGKIRNYQVRNKSVSINYRKLMDIASKEN